MLNFFAFVLVLIVIIKQFAERISRHKISEYSAASTLFLFVSFFPFIMLLLNLIKFLPINFGELTGSSLTMLNSEVSGFVKSIIREINAKASGALISISTIVALWSASKGLLFIIRGLNEIQQTDEKRGYIRLRISAVFFTVILLVAIVITLLLLVFGGSILDFISANLPQYENMDGMLSVVRWIFSFVVLVLFFSLLYAFVPQKKSSLIRQLPGAAVSAIGWLGFSALYSLYVANFGNYSYLYGSFAIIILLLLWLYFCVNILFFGAELNAALYDKDFLPQIKAKVRKRNEEKRIKKAIIKAAENEYKANKK